MLGSALLCAQMLLLLKHTSGSTVSVVSGGKIVGNSKRPEHFGVVVLGAHGTS